MLKHILTFACPRDCSYCITKNVKEKQEQDITKVEKLYEEMRWQHQDIMLTGGEPTSAAFFDAIVDLANKYFVGVHITTQNREIFSEESCGRFDSIVYSLHDIDKRPIVNKVGCKVYASILADQYSDALAKRLKKLGYDGMSINEEQRAGSFFDANLPNIPDFTFKVNRRGHCMDETIIMPDLSICNDFRKYL